jgi:hypothetical protein
MPAACVRRENFGRSTSRPRCATALTAQSETLRRNRDQSDRSHRAGHLGALFS